MKKKLIALFAAALFLVLPCAAYALDWGVNDSSNNLTLYSQPSSSSLPSAIVPPGGTFLIKEGLGNGWFTVEYNGKKAYAMMSADWYILVEDDSPDDYDGDSGGMGLGFGIVISSSVSLRAEPSTSAKLVTTLSNDDNFDVVMSNGSWYFIKYRDKNNKPFEGWVRSEYIVLNPDIVVTNQLAPAYAYPNSGAKHVGQLTKGTRLVVIETYGNYYCVNLRSAAAFVPISYCDPAMFIMGNPAH